jgi:hypothetical protein
MTIFKFSLKNMTAIVALCVKFSVFAAASVTLFSGCVKEYYTTCDHDFAVVDTYYVTAIPNDWRAETGNDGPYFFATHRMPEITTNVINNGIVLCYLIENQRDNLLPYLRPWGFNGLDEPYFHNIRFDIERGFITFIIERSDFEFPGIPNWNMEFKISIIQNYRH